MQVHGGLVVYSNGRRSPAILWHHRQSTPPHQRFPGSRQRPNRRAAHSSLKMGRREPKVRARAIAYLSERTLNCGCGGVSCMPGQGPTAVRAGASVAASACRSGAQREQASARAVMCGGVCWADCPTSNRCPPRQHRPLHVEVFL